MLVAAIFVMCGYRLIKITKMKILKQEYTITNPFDEKMAIEALQKQLTSIIFKELINNEKEAVKLTFLIEVVDGDE